MSFPAEACYLATGDCVAGEPLVCADTEVCDDFRGGCTVPCLDDAECADGAMCNGDETCDLDSGMCLAGTDFECLAGEVCDEATAGCVPDDHGVLG